MSTCNVLQYVTDPSGEWEALYLNGKIVDQGHSLQWPLILSRLDLGFDFVTSETTAYAVYPDNILDLEQ